MADIPPQVITDCGKTTNRQIEQVQQKIKQLSDETNNRLTGYIEKTNDSDR
jgi:hypothetical protein